MDRQQVSLPSVQLRAPSRLPGASHSGHTKDDEDDDVEAEHKHEEGEGNWIERTQSTFKTVMILFLFSEPIQAALFAFPAYQEFFSSDINIWILTISLFVLWFSVLCGKYYYYKMELCNQKQENEQEAVKREEDSCCTFKCDDLFLPPQTHRNKLAELKRLGLTRPPSWMYWFYCICFPISFGYFMSIFCLFFDPLDCFISNTVILGSMIWCTMAISYLPFFPDAKKRLDEKMRDTPTIAKELEKLEEEIRERTFAILMAVLAVWLVGANAAIAAYAVSDPASGVVAQLAGLLASMKSIFIVAECCFLFHKTMVCSQNCCPEFQRV